MENPLPHQTVANAPLEPLENLLRRADALRPDEIDALPYGLIQLDRTGTILKYNKTEASLARINQQRQIGRNFFEHVAPCTKVKDFHGRFLEAVRRRELYETFGFVFDFTHGPRTVAITLFYSQKTDSVWVLVSQLAR